MGLLIEDGDARPEAYEHASSAGGILGGIFSGEEIVAASPS